MASPPCRWIVCVCYRLVRRPRLLPGAHALVTPRSKPANRKPTGVAARGGAAATPPERSGGAGVQWSQSAGAAARSYNPATRARSSARPGRTSAAACPFSQWRHPCASLWFVLLALQFCFNFSHCIFLNECNAGQIRIRMPMSAPAPRGSPVVASYSFRSLGCQSRAAIDELRSSVNRRAP